MGTRRAGDRHPCHTHGHRARVAARIAGGQGHGQGTSPTHTRPTTGHLHRVTAATGQGYLLVAIATAAGAAGRREACWAGGRAGSQRGIWFRAGTGSASPESPTRATRPTRESTPGPLR